MYGCHLIGIERELSPNPIEFQGHTVRLFSTDGKLKTKWSQEANANLTTHGPFFISGNIVVADETKHLMAFRLSDGTLDWSFKFVEWKDPITVIASDQKYIYIGTQDDKLSALELKLSAGR